MLVEQKVTGSNPVTREIYQKRQSKFDTSLTIRIHTGCNVKLINMNRKHEKISKNKPFKPNYRSYKVVLSDGSTFKGKWSFFKRTYDSITDSVNHPVWNPSIGPSGDIKQ